MGAAIALLVIENRTVLAPIDDAFIFYRYARNLVEGHGLVYNVGERVEGFTSLVWTLIVAAGVGAGADAVTFGHWLGVASSAVLLWLTYQYTAIGLVGGERLVAAVSAWLLVLSTPFAVWSMSGLETPLFAAAVLAALLAECHGRTRLALFTCALATLTRPEGVMVGGIVLAFAFFRGKPGRKATFALLGYYVSFLVLLTTFRLFYFGAPLPNTFYAKVGGAISLWGINYFATIFVQVLLPMLWPAAYALRDRRLWPGICWIAYVLVSALSVGGDVFYHDRLFVPALPIACAVVVRGAIQAQNFRGPAARFARLSVPVCCIWFALGTVPGVAASILAALEAGSHRWGRYRAILAVPAISLVAGAALLTQRIQPKKTEDVGHIAIQLSRGELAVRWMPLSTRWAELRQSRQDWATLALVARWTAAQLTARGPQGKLVAAPGIGALGYYSDSKVLDLVGLLDATIARTEPPPDVCHQMALPGHQRTNARYVLSRKPDYIVIPKANESFFRLPAFCELWQDTSFQRDYRWDGDLGSYRRIRSAID